MILTPATRLWLPVRFCCITYWWGRETPTLHSADFTVSHLHQEVKDYRLHNFDCSVCSANDLTDSTEAERLTWTFKNNDAFLSWRKHLCLFQFGWRRSVDHLTQFQLHGRLIRWEVCCCISCLLAKDFVIEYNVGPVRRKALVQLT